MNYSHHFSLCMTPVVLEKSARYHNLNPTIYTVKKKVNHAPLAFGISPDICSSPQQTHEPPCTTLRILNALHHAATYKKKKPPLTT